MEFNFRDKRIDSEDIEVRVQSINKDGIAQVLLYKNARYDQKVLDEVAGPGNWQVKYEEIGGIIFCSLSIWDSSKQQWISKSNAGSQESDSADKAKTIASDGFKRAAFTWGIGVELYDLKAMAVRLNDDEYQVDGTRIRPTSRLRLRDWSVRLTRDAAGAIIDVDILDHLGNSRSLKRKGTVKKQETTVQSTAPSPAPQPAAQRAEAQQPEASAKPWLNRDSEKWEEAIKFVQGGGDVNKILAKYRLSKANEEELKKYSTTKNAV
jgi:hypothetical protein